MSYENWMNYIRNAEKISFSSGEVRKFLYRFNDGNEMIEEYNKVTDVLMRRAWKKNQNNMGLYAKINEFDRTLFDWEIEIGEIIQPSFDEKFLLKEADKMVSFSL